MTTTERVASRPRFAAGATPAVRAEDFHLVRPAAVSRARALVAGGGWPDDEVVTAVAAQLLLGGIA